MPKVFTWETAWRRREEGETGEGEGRRDCIDKIKPTGKELQERKVNVCLLFYMEIKKKRLKEIMMI